MKSIKKDAKGPDREVAAIGSVFQALDGLDSEAQSRVLKYVATRLRIMAEEEPPASPVGSQEPVRDVTTTQAPPSSQETEQDGLEGISPVAQKWMARNGLTAQAISTVFSVGGDEIDLIAKAIPGKSTRDRMHSVVLLKGIAAYLASGAARFTHEQLKEACLHYKAYDAANFAKHLKDFAAEVSGDKATNYVLTARGLANATEILKKMLEPGQAGKA